MHSRHLLLYQKVLSNASCASRFKQFILMTPSVSVSTQCKEIIVELVRRGAFWWTCRGYHLHIYWLRQLRRVRRSLDSESAATLVHAFVTSRVDQCNAVLAGARKSVTDTLQHVMNAAAHVVSDTRKFDHGLTQILRDDLQWLDVADRVTYKLSVIMHRCHDIGYPLLDAEHSLCMAPWSGTPCRTTSVHSRTMNPLDRA